VVLSVCVFVKHGAWLHHAKCVSKFLFLKKTYMIHIFRTESNIKFQLTTYKSEVTCPKVTEIETRI